MKKIKVLFILSVGHSGSTMLDILLGNTPKAQSIGESHNFFEASFKKRTPRTVCSCGKNGMDCPIWSKVYSKMIKKYDGKIPKQNKKSLEDFYSTISEITKKNIIIDSSKRYYRVETLLNSNKIEPYVIFLTRNGKGVLNSLIKKYPKRGNARNLYPWIKRNIETIFFLKKNKKINYKQIKYEEICSNPKKSIKDILKWVDINEKKYVISLNTKGKHIIGGNRMKNKKNMEIKLDEKWKRELSKSSRIFFFFFGEWLNKYLKY